MLDGRNCHKDVKEEVVADFNAEIENLASCVCVYVCVVSVIFVCFCFVVVIILLFVFLFLLFVATLA